MLERTDAMTNEVLEPITFVLAYPTVLQKKRTLGKPRNKGSAILLLPTSFQCCVAEGCNSSSTYSLFRPLSHVM